MMRMMSRPRLMRSSRTRFTWATRSFWVRAG
jgi:hypothetical protein